MMRLLQVSATMWPPSGKSPTENAIMPGSVTDVNMSVHRGGRLTPQYKHLLTTHGKLFQSE
jgi:hypothetical protein